jgi:ABC-type multidrug transport system fused ATPase/permease subunit
MFQAFVAATGALGGLLLRLRPSRARIAITIALMIGAGVLEGAMIATLMPLLSILTGGTAAGTIYRMVPALTQLDRSSQILLFASAIFLLVALKNVAGNLGAASAGKLRATALVYLRKQLLDNLLHAPPARLEAHTTGEIAGAFLAEAVRVNRALDYLLMLTQRAIMALSYLAAVFVLSWQLTIVTLGLGVLLGLTSLVLNRRTLRIGRELAAANLELGREVTETANGWRVIRTTASEAERERSFEKWNRRQAFAEVDASLAQTILTGTMETLGVAGAMAITALAYAIWMSPGSMDVSRFMAFAFALLRLLPALNQVYGLQSAVTAFTGSVEKTLQWLQLPSYPSRPFGVRAVDSLKRGVTFENVSFAYKPGQPALSDISLDLRAGETTAVLGSSGSGKSTLASLLVRLREPQAGRILFDGVDHWEFSPAEFHRAVALVDQDPFLFNASIAENIALGAPGVSRDDVLSALRRVQLGSLIESLPDGIDTVVGERGATLSGGQRQRMAIARAIVRDPKLLILDEPTSALDAATEQEVVAAIEAASAGRTTIIITHRPSTVEHAARTLRIARGRLESVEERQPAPQTVEARHDA